MLISELERSWEGLFPLIPFEYDHLDRQLEERYKSEFRFSNIINGFTIVALALGMLGIFALVSFIIQESMKEISIRKILGASVQVLYLDLCKRFVILIVISSVISIPIGFVVMSKWLNLFSYGVDLGPIDFILPIGILLTIAILVISYKLIKAVTINPASVLRSE